MSFGQQTKLADITDMGHAIVTWSEKDPKRTYLASSDASLNGYFKLYKDSTAYRCGSSRANVDTEINSCYEEKLGPQMVIKQLCNLGYEIQLIRMKINSGYRTTVWTLFKPM